MDVLIKNMRPEDWPSVAEIYAEGIRTGNATFQTEAPSWADWDASHAAQCRLGAFVGDAMAGWAALTPVSGRCVYAGVGEVSVYIAEQFRGLGVGQALLERLIAESEKQGYWTLQAGVFPENTGSVRLHEKCGFRLVGFRERIGQMKNGLWRNTLLFERRSSTVGA